MPLTHVVEDAQGEGLGRVGRPARADPRVVLVVLSAGDRQNGGVHRRGALMHVIVHTVVVGTDHGQMLGHHVALRCHLWRDP